MGIQSKTKNIDCDIEWLQDWSIMIDTLSDNDILQKPHGCCPNSTYHGRLHPHTNAIYDVPLDIMWESGEFEEYSNPTYLNENQLNASTDSAPEQITKTKTKKQSESKEEELCEIYDSIQHEYVTHYICPYLVTMSIQQRKQKKDRIIKFEPKLDDILEDAQRKNNLSLYDSAKLFRQHPIEGNFDCPTTRAWFEYYQEF